jgi:5-methylcytosine-specific restriction endonuclease McrA
MRKYKEYTDEDVISAAAKVKSIAGLLKELKLTPAGGNYANAKRTIQKLKIDCTHWTGQGWNKNAQLKNWSDYSRVAYLKKHLIKERTHKCELCNLDIWQNNLIALEVHHIDGDRTNNTLNNLKLLCPNCHSTTNNYRNRKQSLVA